MVRIKSITIHNFGPYIDEVIEFPEMDGVCFVWGENGSGKTTLLNIFKYAFFGTLFDGKYNQRSKAKAMNYHSNERYFGVTMEFDSDSSTYRLTRNQRLKDNVVKAVDNSSFKEELTLIKDGEVLSPDETKHTLNQLIPEDISQFFFFDSEKLGLFENLMDEDDTNGLGQKVKESIEKILGIPVLKNCVNIMGDITSMYDDKISKALENHEGDALVRQLKDSGKEERLNRYFHRRLMEGSLPLSVGGGIGQSRLCMIYLRKAHIGEIQASIWPDDMRRECAEMHIELI